MCFAAAPDPGVNVSTAAAAVVVVGVAPGAPLPVLVVVPARKPLMITSPSPVSADLVGVGTVRSTVLDPTTNVPSVPRLTTVPASVTAGPPSSTVVLPMAKPVGFAVKTCPPTVKTDDGNSTVLPSITAAVPPGATDIVSPEIVIAGAPAVMGTLMSGSVTTMSCCGPKVGKGVAKTVAPGDKGSA